MQKTFKIALLVTFLVPVILFSGFLIYRSLPVSRLNCEVWSENSPLGQRTEFKVNWRRYSDPQNEEELNDCWLYEIDEVAVTAPDNSVHQLYKDFNINPYSGEITQRWVIYGAQGLNLPPSGDYIFKFIKSEEVILEKTVKYVQEYISFPTNVQVGRINNDLLVNWTAPPEINSEMWYKIIVSSDWDTPYTFFSQIFEWDVESAVLPDVPLLEGESYNLNVAVFYPDGYAMSEYQYFDWDTSL